jgi:hypothetical protein
MKVVKKSDCFLKAVEKLSVFRTFDAFKSRFL